MTRLDVEQLKEKLRALLKEKAMTERTNKTYTVGDLYSEAATLVRSEMAGLKQRPLTEVEEQKSKDLARLISKMVLKEMKIS